MKTTIRPTYSRANAALWLALAVICLVPWDSVGPDHVPNLAEKVTRTIENRKPMKTKFVYLERSPKLHGKARQFGASYRRMMVLELEEGAEIPPAVKPGARGLVRIVAEATESIGKTAQSFGFRERARLRALADSLNAETATT